MPMPKQIDSPEASGVANLKRIPTKQMQKPDGNGLIPKSAPMAEDIAEFWGKHLLGPGWRKAEEAEP